MPMTHDSHGSHGSHDGHDHEGHQGPQPHSHGGAGHTHDHAAGASERALLIALGLTAAFLAVEVAGGILSNSLALLSDAAHMFADTAALAIAWGAIRIGQRAADAKRTFGYYRFEILAAAFNAVMLLLAGVYILYEAYVRLKAPPEVRSGAMLGIAALGLVVNLVGMKVLSSGKDLSLNIKGAYLEVWSDMLGSLGVIAGALVIRFTGWTWVDSVVAVLIGLWVLPRTWSLLRTSVNILLEGVPHDIDFEGVKQTLADVPGVRSLHDLHVWALSSGKASLTVHLVHETSADPEDDILPLVRDRLDREFGIRHITVQFERKPCAQNADDYHFMAPADAYDPARRAH